MESVTRVLPERFNYISKIQTIELRIKLTEIIFSLLDLLNDYENFDPDLTAKNLVDNFFKYLLKSCEDRESLERRCRWLLVYAEIVQTRLLVLRAKRMHLLTAADKITDPDFVIRVDTLLDAVSVHRITKTVSNELDTEITKVMEELVILSSQVIPDRMNKDYIQLVERVCEVTQALTEKLDTGVDDNYGETLMVELLGLRYSLTRYLLIHGSHRQ